MKEKKPRKTSILVGKHFGPDKIVNVIRIDEKTYLGNKKSCLIFTNGEEKEMPLEMAERASTLEPTDLTQLRDLVVIPLVEKMLGMIVDSGLTLEDTLHAINSRLKMSLDDSLERAATKLWGKPHEKLTFADAEKVLTNGNSNQKAESKNDESPSA